MGRGVGAHQLEVIDGRARWREAGGGLHEVATGRLRQAAGPDLLVVGQVGILEDDLDDGARVVGYLGDGGDVRLDLRVPARLEGADEQHHVQLGGPVAQCGSGLGHLDVSALVAVGKTDGRADLDVRARQDVPGTHHVRRLQQTEATS